MKTSVAQIGPLKGNACAGRWRVATGIVLAGLLMCAPIRSAYAEQTSPDAHDRASLKETGKMTLKKQTVVIDISTLKTISDVIENAAGKKIIYVGEYHDQYAHHQIELEVIKGLFQRDAKLAVGMEMFQRPFQNVLDEYIAGKLTERDFLKQSEYFKRWGFDYTLYKPIIDFARSEKIPVIALNIRRELVDKVSKGGLAALTEEEKKDIPLQMDLSDNAYRDRLKEIFNQHRGSEEKNFDFFYQAQVLWDETMAQSVDEYLKQNPDTRMIVLAGSGHLAYGSGVPKRAFRRNRLPYTIVLNDSEEVERDIANYLVFPEEVEGMPAPLLMLALKVENNRVFVAALSDNSVSRKAGIKEGDAILSFDGTPVNSVEDLKLELLYKKKGDTVKVKVLRNRFLFGSEEMNIDVKL